MFMQFLIRNYSFLIPVNICNTFRNEYLVLFLDNPKFLFRFEKI
jgi:hypothetical protein